MAGERHPISFSSLLFSCRWPPSVASADLPRKAARRPRRASPRGFLSPDMSQPTRSSARAFTPRRATMASALRPCPFPRRPRQSRPCRRARHRQIILRLVLRRGTKPYFHTCPGTGAERAAGDGSLDFYRLTCEFGPALAAGDAASNNFWHCTRRASRSPLPTGLWVALPICT